MSERKKYIDAVKGFCILFVLIGHAEDIGKMNKIKWEGKIPSRK